MIICIALFILLISNNLIGIDDTAHTVLDSENVVVHSINIGLDVGRLTDDTSGVEAAKVEGTSGLELGGVEAEGVDEDVGGSRRGHVEVGRSLNKVGLGGLGLGDVGAVDLKLDLIVVHGERGSVLAGKELDGVVEHELGNLGVGGGDLLDLSDEHIVGLGDHLLALIGIEVNKVGKEIHTVAGGSARTPIDAKLNIVVLKSNKRKSRLPVFTEAEAEGVDQRVSTTVDTLRTLGEVVGKSIDRNILGEDGILGIDNLTTDKEFNLVDVITPVSVLGDTRGVRTGHVNVADKVTLAFETHGGHVTGIHSALNDLPVNNLGKVGVSLVTGSEKGNLGIANNVSVLGANGDELSNTTRHLYTKHRDFYDLCEIAK